MAESLGARKLGHLAATIAVIASGTVTVWCLRLVEAWQFQKTWGLARPGPLVDMAERLLSDVLFVTLLPVAAWLVTRSVKHGERVAWSAAVIAGTSWLFCFLYFVRN